MTTQAVCTDDELTKRRRKSELYRELYVGNYNQVINICREFDDGPLHVITIHNDTTFHKAAYTKKFDLADRLLELHLEKELPDELLTRKNDWGNTLLHNASTSNKGVGLLRRLLEKAPQLLKERNNWGETAVFQASRYGRREVFEFLAGKVDDFCRLHGFNKQGQEEMKRSTELVFFQRDDKTTVLHMAVLTGNYDMALMIAKTYPHLCNAWDMNEVSALKTLASNPKAFKSGTQFGILSKLIYSCLSTDEQGNQADEARGLIGQFQKAMSCLLCAEGNCCCRWPLIKKARELKKSHTDALKLAKFLILQVKETTWMETCKPNAELTPNIDPSKHKTKVNGETSTKELHNSYNQQTDHDIESFFTIQGYCISYIDDTPLIWAAKRGCVEIVEAILDEYPQAVEYLNKKGRNISLVSIKNRHFNVFQLVLQKKFDVRSNLRVIDNNGNSILHMVGLREFNLGERLNSPVILLSEDLRLLEDLKQLCPNYLINHRNRDRMTADELFAFNTEKLRCEAKDWLRRTSEHCTVVILLIITVAFAAAYTVPGGPNQNTGYPILIGQSWFLAFALTDVFSLAFALTAVVVFLGILTSSFALHDFKRNLPTRLLLGFTLLFLSVSMMMVSYASTVILMMHDRQQWTRVVVYVAAFSPICIFLLSYVPVYIKLGYTFRAWAKKIRITLPRCVFGSSLKNTRAISSCYPPNGSISSTV